MPLLAKVASIISNYFSCNMGFEKIDNSAIKSSLEGVRRQYLVGNLKLPQSLPYIKSEALEIGISSYKEYTEEVAHKHTTAAEYQYVISGWTKYFNTETHEEFEFRKGDFYAIEKGTPYAQKCKAGTEILFIKVPSINDKTVVDVDLTVQEWYGSKMRTVRTDYSHKANMPVANSIRPAAAVAILKEDKVLMLHRKDNSKWTLPGGTLELNESMIDCAVREVQEECGLKVSIQDILGTYTDPDIRIAYSDGEVRREFTIVYIGNVSEMNVTIDGESRGYKWVLLSEAQSLPMAESQKSRIADLVEYVKTKKRIFK